MPKLIMTRTESNTLLDSLNALMSASRKAGQDSTIPNEDMSDAEYKALVGVMATVNGMLASNVEEIQREADNRNNLWRAAGISAH